MDSLNDLVARREAEIISSTDDTQKRTLTSRVQRIGYHLAVRHLIDASALRSKSDRRKIPNQWHAELIDQRHSEIVSRFSADRWHKLSFRIHIRGDCRIEGRVFDRTCPEVEDD